VTETHRPPAERERTSGGTATRSRTARLGLFYRQVIAELRKVVWPTRSQLITYTAVVLVFVGFIIAVVSLLDLAFGWLVLEVFGG
jgi:preprotein translocase subunit SecE